MLENKCQTYLPGKQNRINMKFKGILTDQICMKDFFSE